MPKSRILVVLAVAIVLGIAFIMYRSYSPSPRLNVEPHAAKEIEKAKRR